VPDDEYQDFLLSGDVVVSAAGHEFFGMAIVEAIAAGAVPILPNRLSFPELIEPSWHQTTLYPDGELRNRLRSVLTDVGAAKAAVDGLRKSMVCFDAATSATAHDDAIDQLMLRQR